MFSRRSNGFTIIELLIVVVVIAILAAITIVAYSGIQAQARDSVVKSDAQSVISQLEHARVLTGKYPTDPAELNGGSGIAISSGNDYVYHSTGSSYCVSLRSIKGDSKYYVSSTRGSFQLGMCPQDAGSTVATLAGNGTLGFANGTGASAVVASPAALFSGQGGALYFTDSSTSRIRKVTESGVVTTIAGNGPTGVTEGVGNAALFNWPMALTIGFGGHLYAADSNNNRIRTIPLNSTSTSTFAGSSAGSVDGTGAAARFNVPRGIAYDESRGYIYIADSQNNLIRRINSTQAVSVLAGQIGGGFTDHTVGTSAQFNYPQGLALGSDGTIYVADTNNHRIRMVSPSGSVTTLTGGASGNQDGAKGVARLNAPSALAVSSSGVVYVSDAGNHSIRKVMPDGTVSTIAGNGTAGFAEGLGTEARFNTPRGIAIGSDGRLYVADTANHRIRVITNI